MSQPATKKATPLPKRHWSFKCFLHGCRIKRVHKGALCIRCGKVMR